jgi:hypothetical protein
VVPGRGSEHELAALDIPTEAAFRINIAPLTVVTLSFSRVWRLQSLGEA